MSTASRQTPLPLPSPSGTGTTARTDGQSLRRYIPRPILYFVRAIPTGKAFLALITAVAALVLATVLMEAPVLRHTGGSVLFPTDNAFMNISVAQNLAFHHVL